jgi:hypothetical protein
MAQSGFTPVSLYYSTTASAVPVNTNLANGELALNIQDEKLYFKNAAGTVKLLASNAASATSGTSILYGNGSGGFSNVTIGSGISFAGGTLSATGSGGTVTSVAASVPSFLSISGSPITSSGTLAITYSGTALPIANGGTGATTLAGANIAVTNATNTFTATQTFSGSTSTFGASLLDSNETVNVVGSAPSATTNLYVQSGSVQYYTSNAANNFVVNLAFSSGTSMNTALATGQSVTAALVTTQNATAYYATSIQVDGTTSGVTTRWIGGAPTAGNASGLDVYRFAVIKTASATYTVLASLTQFK